MLELDVRHSKQSVLILHQTDGFKIFSPGVSDITDIDDIADCSFTINQKPSDFSAIKTTYECNVENVIGYEVYSYFEMKMNGFSRTDGGSIGQMILTTSNSNLESAESIFYSTVEL